MLFCLLSAFFFFQNKLFKKNIFLEYRHYSFKPSECHTVLDPDQAQYFVGPDLGPNCLQKLSADDTSKQRVIR